MTSGNECENVCTQKCVPRTSTWLPKLDSHFYYAKKIKIKIIGECDTNKNNWGVIHMSNSIQFMKDLQKGKQREELFIKWCDNRGLKYLDVRDDEYYRAIDVDFLIHVHDIFSDTYVPIDVKCCSLKKGSIMVEMTSGKYGNSGWFEHGKAEWYVYTAPLQSTDGYLILTLRKTWIEEWIGYYNVKTQRIGDGTGYFIKLNNNNKYQINRCSIVEYVLDNYDEQQIFWYVDSEGKALEVDIDELDLRCN